VERTYGIEEARGKLGRLADEVAEGGEAVILAKRGRAAAVLVAADEYLRFKLDATREAREQLGRELAKVRRRVAALGLDPALVDEAIEAARRLP
jgi:prevent-host-death family protein